MASEDLDYYRGRALEERELAEAADRQDVAEIHRELARLYEALVAEPALRPTLRISFPKRAAG